MKTRRDFLGQRHLGILGVAPTFHFGLERRNLGQALERQQRVPVPHQRVADRQHLGKHGVRVFGDADVVVLGLGHLVHAVQAHQQGHGEYTLRLLAILLLQVAAHEQVELLVRTAQLQIALQGY